MSENTIGPVGRRDALGVIGGLSALAAMPAMAQAATPAAATSTPERMRTFMMLRGALDDRLVINWMHGQYFGLVAGEITPLFGVVNALLARYKRHADGGYVGARGEISYFTDLQTGAILKEFRNPYTGATVPVPSRGYPPSPVRITPDLTIHISEHLGEKLDDTISPVFRNGNDVWMSEINQAKTQLPGGKVSLYNEVVTYRAKATDLARPDARRVPCDTSFTSTVSWRSWLNMGDHPGHMMAVGAGTYVPTMDALPPLWLAETRRTQPDVVNKPLAFLDPVWTKLD